MISFNIVALYLTVPQDKPLNTLRGAHAERPRIEGKTPIPAEELMDLFKYCLERSFFAFNSQLYVQIDGIAIRSSSSVFLVEIFMIRLERKAHTSSGSPSDI